MRTNQTDLNGIAPTNSNKQEGRDRIDIYASAVVLIWFSFLSLPKFPLVGWNFNDLGGASGQTGVCFTEITFSQQTDLKEC